MDNRKSAYEDLIALAEKQGYLTFDNIMEKADEYSLPIQDFDWLSNSITTLGIIVYDEVPSYEELSKEEEEKEEGCTDRSLKDYELVYDRIIELCPELKSFVSFVRNVRPPQRGEVKQLKYQVAEGNIFARNRMIEMYLRLALGIALQRAETYDIDIEDAIGFAYAGLVVAVDKYDPDTSGYFISYASMWIFQYLSKGNELLCKSVQYPSYIMQQYFAVYPFLKKYGCIGCNKLWQCKEVRDIIRKETNCSEKRAGNVLSLMISDERIEDVLDCCSDNSLEDNFKGMNKARLLGKLSITDAFPNEKFFQLSSGKTFKEIIYDVLSTLPPREEKVLRLRFGLEGRELTLEEIGVKYNVTRERVRQIEKRALRRLRKPSILKQLAHCL